MELWMLIFPIALVAGVTVLWRRRIRGRMVPTPSLADEQLAELRAELDTRRAATGIGTEPGIVRRRHRFGDGEKQRAGG